MLKLVRNEKINNCTMKIKEITQCGYMGYEFDSGVIRKDISSAITIAIGLMKLPIVQSVSVISANKEITCTYYKDHEQSNGKRVVYEDNVESHFFKMKEYKYSIIRIATYQLPVKHLNNIIHKIDDFDEFIKYLSYFFVNPVSKPIPQYGYEALSIQDRIDLINCKDMDYTIAYESEEEDEIEDFQSDNYYEIDGTLSRNEILELEKAIVECSTRIEAIMYLDEEHSFLTTYATDDKNVACSYRWKWKEEIVNLEFMLINAPIFDVDLNYFKVAVKLSVSDLEIIQNLHKARDVLQYLKK